MAESVNSRARRPHRKNRDLSIEGKRRRSGWIGLLAAVLVAFATLTPTPAMAADMSITISPPTATTQSNVATTYLLTVSCSSAAGTCANSTVTIPTTTITGNGANNDFGSWITAGTCPALNRSVPGQVSMSFGTLTSSTGQCSFTVLPPEYKTLNNAVATITPTLSSSNAASATATPATLTVTAAHNVSVAAQAPNQVITGTPYQYSMILVCGLNGGYVGDIGTSAIELSAVLPANFEYQSYSPRNNVPGTFSYDPATRRFTFSDPSGTACGNPPLNINNRIIIALTGTATTGGVPNPVGSQICATTSATWTYLDGVPGSGSSASTCSTVIAANTTVSKSVSSSTLSNLGQYTLPDGSRPAYTYPGNWDGTGASTYFDLAVANTAGTTNAGLMYDIKDPVPCMSNFAGGIYSSNAVGDYCANPAFIPTLVTPFNFPQTGLGPLTLVYTDGSTGTAAFTAGRGWIIPTSPVVAEVQVPPFANEGSNTAGSMTFRLFGYAASGVQTTTQLRNTVSSTPYQVGSSTPLGPVQTASRNELVVAPPAGGGAIVYPALQALQVGATCTANVTLNGANSYPGTRIEIPTGPSREIYVDYLAPAGATTVNATTTTFSLLALSPTGSTVRTTTSAPVAPTVTQNYNGTGRTLVRYVVPANLAPQAGSYRLTSASFVTLTLEAGCAGTYQNDLTVGYAAPITQCYLANGRTSGISAAPLVPYANADLRANSAPTAGNYCGESWPLKIAAIRPKFSVDKTVQGNLDAVPIGGGGTGHVSADGGAATYTVSFSNSGESTLVDPVMYDLLPRVGDTRASSTAARGSQFAVTLTDVAALPSRLTVAYSQAVNPCRPEVLAANPGCVNDWTTTAPASLSTVTALKFVYSGSITVGNGFSATYSVATPATTAGGVAWNSIGTNVTAGDALVGAAESSLTGLQAQSAQPAITKTADRATVDAVGQQVTFTFTVTNNTAVTLTNVRVADALVNSASSSTAPTPSCSALTTPTGTCSGASTTLLAGQSATFTATYTTTQADLDHGSVSDQATATATPPTGPNLSNSTGVVTVTAAQNGALTLNKTALPGTVDSVGDVIDYTFEVTNAGNVTLRTLSIVETDFTGSGSLSSITCPSGALAPGATVDCTATYPVTQADLTAGSVANTATANALSPSGGAVVSPASTATVDVDQVASLDLVKSATPAGAASYNAGQLITYSFVVTNTGNVPVTGITVDEVAFTGSGAVSAIDCPADSLAPAAQFTCTATYTLTQADVDAESVRNTARANGTAATGPVVSNDSAVTTPQVPASSLALTKTASTSFVNAAAETVTYSFAIRNEGNVTVSDVAVDETDFTGTGATPTVTCPTSTLAPGQQVVCTADYTVTQGDMDNGGFDNTARATAQDTTGGDVVSPASSATVTANVAAALTVVKTAGVATYDAVGDDVRFSFLVTNSGNVALADITIDERAFTGTGVLGEISCLGDELAPGQSLTCTAEYDATQADIDAGGITNTAAAIGTFDGDTITSPTSTVTVGAEHNASLVLDKSVTPDEADAAGDEVEYSFHVTNTGNVSVTALQIIETDFSGTGGLAAPVCSPRTLAPGADVTCTTTYRLTQDDVDAGEVTNTATAGGTAAGAAVSSAASSAAVTVERRPELSLVKSADVVDPDVIRAGDVIAYSFVITNTGNVTITDVGVQEGAFSGTGDLGDVTCEDSDPLAPDDQLVCSLEYTVTQADVDSGELSNTATATGTGPAGTAPPTSEESTVELPAPAAPALTLKKTTDVTKITGAGQLVAYTFTITNTGNTTARDVTVSEEAFSGHGDDLAVSCPSGVALLPGQVAVCTATYTVVAGDLDGSALVNIASAKSVAPGGATVTSAPSTARIDDVLAADPPAGHGLAITGGTIAWSAGILAVSLVIAGAVLLLVRRRRQPD